MARYDPGEAERRLIGSLSPNEPCGRGPRGRSRVVDGILYMLRTGSPWHGLPSRYGPHTTV